MVAKTMLFGPIGRQIGVPWPDSGMSMDNNLLTETTDLLNGEQSVWRAPLTYRSYGMSWKGGSDALQPLVDVHAGLYGQGPYYITDPLAAIQGNNLLPFKWASPFLLEHVANGWGSPVTAAQTVTPEQRQITFTGTAGDPDESPFNIVVPCVPGEPMYFTGWGTSTGTAGVRVYRYSQSAAAWQLFNTHVPTVTADAPLTVRSQAEADANDIVAIKLVPYIPTGSTLTLQHFDLAVNDYRAYSPYSQSLLPARYPALTLYPGMVLYPMGGPQASMFRSGKGTGPVQFTGNIGGKLDSATMDSIGLSLDIREVSRDRNN
ncbi:hypothetical protein [uncultured Arthrobacter sp.]|uniref:hypothetical protein n=1 Tax=uncultured Arthrobacter sp. TaxID=114050 RepID=UPI0032162F23